MKRFIAFLALGFSIGWLAGCKPATSTPTPVAPGYLNSADQTLGETLAALNGFVTQEVANYKTDDAAIQAAEKAPLNAFITAVDLANAAYTAYHAGTGTLAEAQTAVSTAQNDQAVLVAAKGVK